MEVGLRPVHIVLDGNTAPVPKKGAEPPQFLAHLYCGQTAVWIKMLLGAEVGLGLRNTVVDVDLATPEKGTPTPSQFWPLSIVAKWLDG